jgi:hypothetical protein
MATKPELAQTVAEKQDRILELVVFPTRFVTQQIAIALILN